MELLAGSLYSSLKAAGSEYYGRRLSLKGMVLSIKFHWLPVLFWLSCIGVKVNCEEVIL